VGLVVDFGCDLTELVAMGASVVEAEQQLTSARKDNAYICLRAAAVTTVGSGQNWSRWGNGACHAYLQQSVARNPSGPLLARVIPDYACSIGIQASTGRENAHRHGTF
jgi:hypothetical protein